MTLIERFLKFVPDQPKEGCWLWSGALKFKAGYGLFWLLGKTVRAHRLAWELFKGPIPHGIEVLHRCDVRACVRPDHLFLGTKAENSLDMWRKGRSIVGERSHFSKLTNTDVDSIRCRYASGETQTAIAADYQVHQTTIHMVVKRKKWKHRPDPQELRH